MRISTPALFLLFSVGLEARAFDARSSLSRATERVHKFALRHSAGLARDLRLILRNLDQQPLSKSTVTHRVYCTKASAFDSESNDSSPATPTTGLTGGNNNNNNDDNDDNSDNNNNTSSTTSGGGPRPTPSSAFRLVEEHSGQNFFNGWDFFTHPDPTNGIVDYVDERTARSNDLLEINDEGNAIMRVETTPRVSGNRQSVRITTSSSFTGGIFVLDATHMPTGCGTWPAFWSNGPNWPVGGEIDILEGVHEYTNNQATLHTASGCTLPSGASAQSLAIQGTLIGGSNCAALETGNAGCGVRSTSSNSYGAGFNSVGGGVYAMVWDDDGIAVYFFQRGSIPSDLIAEAPRPSQWGNPMALWPSSSCNTDQFFYNHSVIFDTTLCGDWAGGVWNTGGIPGQEQSCAQRTGSASCEDYVRNNGATFNEAYWEVKSVKIYQTSRRT